MTQKNEASGEQKITAENRPAGKKPYSKPEFRYERVFETMALACGKIQTGSTCKMAKKVS